MKSNLPGTTSLQNPNLDNLPQAEVESAESTPKITTPIDVRSITLTGLFILALFYTLYLASAFFLPLTLAVLLNFLLRPAVRWLKRIRVPEMVGAGVIIAGFLGIVAIATYELSGPAARWVSQAPATLNRIEAEVKSWRGPVQQMSKAAEQVERITSVDSNKEAPTVELKQPTLAENFLEGTRSVLAAASVIILLLYFLLASGDLFLGKLVRVLPTLTDKKKAVQIAYDMEDQISVYLVTVMAINIGLGVAESIAMYLLGMPNPLLWGAMAAVLNFVPYLGAITGGLIVGGVAYVTFGQVEWGLIVSSVYLSITAIEGGVITPMLLARRLTLNPVVVLVGIVFWGWLWGIAGALIAVPLMVTLKIFCDHIGPLAPIGEFMGD